ncbi:TIGR02466 family protein [Actomonas aquatica]|uniref:TIGR02466 family protein n=1 Tax=Actomonas aquatica TaxID=2866162 RepID=A0ABZ1C650_9BACT|nr:TIGR02466 family protein [Opitutus sp. WL0086]WRQ87208.1 TIGR02466 family protein [Opitutus sp. WL0086]
MPVHLHFPTYVYCEPLQPKSLDKLNAELVTECDQLRAFDVAGRKWSEKNYPGGYTSYASMNELHRFSSTFEALQRKIDKHVKAYAKALDFDLRGADVRMTDCWVNMMPPGTTHALHIHPLSFISGTYYVQTPEGCPGIKFEDPRLDRFMAAPPRKAKCKPENEAFVTYPAQAGNVVLFESWLRHEVPANQVQEERISISFNYAWN